VSGISRRPAHDMRSKHQTHSIDGSNFFKCRAWKSGVPSSRRTTSSPERKPVFRERVLAAHLAPSDWLALLLGGRLLGVIAALVFRVLSGHRQVFAFSLGHELVLSSSTNDAEHGRVPQLPLDALGFERGSATAPQISLGEEHLSDIRLGHPHPGAEQPIVRFPEPSANFPAHVHLY
jgi:hypothetical protein